MTCEFAQTAVQVAAQPLSRELRLAAI